MKRDFKAAFRAAVEISQRLGRASFPTPLSPIEESIDQVRRWQHRLELATKRNWPAAARDSADRLRGALEVLSARSARATDDLERQYRASNKPSATLIFTDLEALKGEFDSLTIDLANQMIAVETASIVLEGIYLGRFEIRLNWRCLQESSPFEVIAVDPNPASSGDEVFHPHVQSGSLCEGEGSDAIRRALDEGRIYDFYCIVDQILRTYNSASAYVQLEDWEGVCCKACGDCVDADEACACCKCETELCTDCSICCDSCADRYCTHCVSSCPSCGDDCCTYCMKSCDQCSEEYCPSCLNEGICDDCTERENQTLATDSTEAERPCTPIHTVCNGKTAVLA